MESPKSPRITRPRNFKYWTTRGRSSPSSVRSRATSAVEANSPSMIVTGSPGVRWSIKKVAKVTPRSVGTSRRIRRVRKTRISRSELLQRDIRYDHEPVRMDLRALHIGLHGRIGHVVPQRHPQGLVNNVFLNVTIESEPFALIGLPAGGLNQPVELGILVVAERQPGPDVGRMKPDLDDIGGGVCIAHELGRVLTRLEFAQQRPEFKGLDLHRDAECAQLRLHNLRRASPGVDWGRVQHKGKGPAVFRQHPAGADLPSRLRQECLGLSGIV